METLEKGGQYIQQIRQKIRSGELDKTEGARLIFKRAANWRAEIRKTQQNRRRQIVTLKRQEARG